MAKVSNFSQNPITQQPVQLKIHPFEPSGAKEHLKTIT